MAGAERFTEFYEANADALVLFFARRVFDPEVALDLTAETFAQAFLGREKLRGDSEAEAVAWVYGIARNLLSQYWRKARVEREALNRLGIDVPELSLADHDRIEELAGNERLRGAARDGMRDLSASERDAIRLRVIEELPYPQVAARLAISEEAARARVSRGMRRLAAELEGAEIEEESWL